MEKIAKGIWKLTLGEPEKFTPMSLLKTEIAHKGLEIYPEEDLPLKNEDVCFKTTNRGCTVEIPMNNDENFFGFGLQFYSVNHAGRKKYICVNSDPVADTGESHAPVPFFATTGGYGLYIDSARYISVCCGTNSKKGASRENVEVTKTHTEFSENALYSLKKSKEKREIIIDIPAAKGIDLYFFSGDIKTVVSKYNLFSGGGCIPPLWGLGNWYRAYGGSNQKDIISLAEYFRKNELPVDVLGLEPGWHSHSYSCSYKWKEELFPQPQEMLDYLNENDYKVNLWEHIFVHPTADIYDELKECSGDYEVWNGLVPDFALEDAKNIFKNHHTKEFIDKGITGFKLDECDNSDYNPSNWSFPDTSEFPSGLDGEQMHNTIGLLYQKTLLDAFKDKNQRTLSQVRSSGALASEMPFVLYSDLYSHKHFITALVNSGFSGLLWAPEVRSCKNTDDLIRRMQTIIFSHHSLLNCWRIPNPPWLQVNIDKNLSGEFMDKRDEITDICKKLLELRMSLIPYIYSSFYNYYLYGVPPIRSLVMDYENDGNVCLLKNEYMFGESMLVAPLTADDNNARNVYLPNGEWFDFWTNEKFIGGQNYQINAEIDKIPVFVKSGSIIPFSKPLKCISKDSIFEITVLCYGNGYKEFTLYEDDGFSFDYTKGKFNRIKITCDENNRGSYLTDKKEGLYKSRYEVKGFEYYG